MIAGEVILTPRVTAKERVDQEVATAHVDWFTEYIDDGKKDGYGLDVAYGVLFQQDPEAPQPTVDIVSDLHIFSNWNGDGLAGAVEAEVHGTVFILSRTPVTLRLCLSFRVTDPAPGAFPERLFADGVVVEEPEA
jgi:hypothetical protein